MFATPGTLMQFASQARKDVQDYRHWAQEATDPERKRYYLRCAENREDDARWYSDVASRGVIDGECNEMKEAAE